MPCQVPVPDGLDVFPTFSLRAKLFMIHEVAGDILLTKAQAVAHGVAPNDHFDSGLALAHNVCQGAARQRTLCVSSRAQRDRENVPVIVPRSPLLKGECV